jgi:PAS domain S-box-containing protein
MLKGNISLIHLKEYFTFLYNNHLKELSFEDLKRNKELDLPLLKYFAHLSEKELAELSEKGMKEYLLNLIEDKAIPLIHKSMEDWKADRLPGISRDQVIATDIVLIYNARKHTLVKFLPRYTQSPEKIVTIVNELENFYSFQESLAMHTFVDIKQAEIRENEQRLNDAQEVAHLGNWEYNKATGKTYWSPHLYKIYGIKKEDFPEGISASQAEKFMNKEDVEGLRKVILEAEKIFGKYNYEVAIAKSDGEKRILSNEGYVEKNDKGEIIVKGISQDITERKKAEEGLRQKDLFIAHVAQSSPDFIYIFDLKENKYIYVNKEISSLLGYDKQIAHEKKAEFLSSLVHPEDEKVIKERTKKFAILLDNEILEDEVRFKDAKGNWMWLNFRTMIFNRTPEGKASQIIGTARDITKDKNNQQELLDLNKDLNSKNEELTVLQEELQVANGELMESNLKLDDKVSERTLQLENKNKDLTRINSDLDNFIYTASHDLKAPISNIEGLIMSLREALQMEHSPKDGDTEIILEMIDKSIIRFKETISDLTEISKAQKLENEDIEDIDCPQIIKNAQEDIRDLIKASGARINISLKNCNSIKFSKKNFKSIIYNLLSNAIKYRHPDRIPEISITSEKMTDFLKLTVKDNGLGISPTNIPKMFTMFKRFHDHVEGSGIGLYIVKRILDNAGGRIEVTSEQGIGTTFNVYIRIKE